jgi:prepilin-type N-terminal cleavage/methylation domain-containing protein
MPGLKPHRALTLIEVILAMALLTVIATTVLYFSRQPSEQVKHHTCELHAKRLQVVAAQYRVEYGQWPSSTMIELTVARYLGEPLPVCPLDGQAYRLNRVTGEIVPHTHVVP